MIYPVILCGGSGTRLWPVSRKAYPKQFVPLLSDDSLYQATLKRFSGPDFAAPLVMTGDDFRFLATDQAAAAGIADARVVVEPVARDTAPAILTAALMLAGHARGADAGGAVGPRDRRPAGVPGRGRAPGSRRPRQGALVTFGVTPDRPETGYGYLELAAPARRRRPPVALKSFREKPDAGRAAEAMIAAGQLPVERRASSCSGSAD